MKAKTYASLKEKLDGVFSEWTRRRFAANYGSVRCVSCGTLKAHWKEIQAGHFVSRVRLATRWTPENVAPQCGACNVLRRGNYAAYSRWMENRYGPSIFATLDDASRKPTKFTRADLQQMIDDFTLKIRAMT